MEDIAAALGGTTHRTGTRQVANGDLDVEFLKPGGIAAWAREAADLIALVHQPSREVPADEAGRARDQAHVVLRRIDPLAAEHQIVGHRRLVRHPPANRRGGDVAHDSPVLARGAMNVGEYRIERVEKAARLRV